MSALALSGIFLFGEVSAHGGATGVIKERMELMKSLGDRMKEMGAMVKGKAPFDAAAMADSARKIQQTAPEIAHLFPEGSLHKLSKALPAVWKEREKFNELTERLIQEAGNLNDVAMTGDRRSMMIQFTKVGKTCSSCHTDFRKKKKD
jgi:cytochrome c556